MNISIKIKDIGVDVSDLVKDAALIVRHDGEISGLSYKNGSWTGSYFIEEPLLSLLKLRAKEAILIVESEIAKTKLTMV